MLLNSLHIKGFRGFTDFKVEGLGQVNLIVGRNNAGKTSLLEAVYLFSAVQGDPFVAIARDEDLPNRHLNLFNGRPSPYAESHLSISGDVPELNFQIDLKQGGLYVNRHFLQGTSFGFRVGEAPPLMPSSSPVLLEPGTSTPARLARQWSQIQLTPLQDDVEACLRLVLPDLVDVGLHPETKKGIVRLKDTPAPVSMASLGGGVARLFDLACGLAVSKDSVCLVEEIESGVHHSVHAEMWKFVFTLAKRYNAQVFATTHSLDCLRGFAWASHELPEVSARVIRLENQKGQVAPVTFDERRFQIAAFDEIEIR